MRYWWPWSPHHQVLAKSSIHAVQSKGNGCSQEDRYTLSEVVVAPVLTIVNSKIMYKIVSQEVKGRQCPNSVVPSVDDGRNCEDGKSAEMLGL